MSEPFSEMKSLRTAVLPAMALWLLLPLNARARTVTITITGTVVSGLDGAGAFGNIRTDLTNQPFTLVLKFDDSQGAQTIPSCGPGTSYSQIAGGGTGTLQIGASAPYPFGTGLRGEVTSWVRRTISPRGYQIEFGIDDGSDKVEGYVANTLPAPPSKSNCLNDWRARLTDSRLSESPPDPAGLPRIRFNTAYNTSARGAAAGGLTPATIRVEGEQCAPPLSDSLFPISLYRQHQSNWCWAAVAEILMNQVGAQDVPQCKQAAFGGAIDCCQSPTPSSCNRGASVGVSLQNFGFTADYSKQPLSYEQIKKEISCHKQPIAFRWGRVYVMKLAVAYHDMIIFGYETAPDGNFVLVYDPGRDKSERIPYDRFAAPGAYYLWHRGMNISFVANWYNVRQTQ